MTTPEDSSLNAALIRARNRAQDLAATYPPPWELTWKRPRTPKSKTEKKREPRKQRRRLQDAGRRHFSAGLSRRPRSRQSRIDSAAARRDGRILSQMRRSTWLW